MMNGLQKCHHVILLCNNERFDSHLWRGLGDADLALEQVQSR